jgi:gamma-glutamylcyclotransferase (GGCT)/AIG2-like uncharacterized protein YtfP
MEFAGLKFRSPAFLDNAILVTANGYAAAALGRRNGVVKGELVEVETSPKSLKYLIANFDQWESHYPDLPTEESFYLRKTLEIRLPSNRRTEATVYFINEESNFKNWIRWDLEIPNGDWQEHIKIGRS